MSSLLAPTPPAADRSAPGRPRARTAGGAATRPGSADDLTCAAGTRPGRARRVWALAAAHATALLAALAVGAAPVRAQMSESAPPDTVGASVPIGGALASTAAVAAEGDPVATAPRTVSRYRSTRDSLVAESTREAAERAGGLRLVVLLERREMLVLDGADTLRIAPVAIGVDTTISFGTRSWTFDTPRGKRTVLRKQANPVWVPPDWHYVEVAGKRDLELRWLKTGRRVPLADGRTLTMRGGRAGVVELDGAFTALPTDEEIVFDGVLYVPPLGSANRRIEGELGRFRLDLGNGYLLHGTPHEDTIGSAATHGCVRLYDEDIEWLYSNVPVGTAVYIY